MMSQETEITRNTALSILNAQSMPWTRVGNGQRFVIDIAQGSNRVRALVKTASRGSAMVRTNIDDAENAKISGFEDDVDRVLFAVGDPDRKTVDAYLVPLKEADRAYRTTHKEWRNKRPTGTENKTWVIWFNEGGDSDCNGFHRKWAQYRIGGSSEPLSDASRRADVVDYMGAIAEAKRNLAVRLGIDPSSIKITIES